MGNEMATPEATVLLSMMAPMKRPTILDVARACGVAKSTVSVVLNQSPAADRVPEETRARVRKIADHLGYRASWRARVLAAKQTGMIGVLYTPPMPLIARGNYEGILSGINETLAAHDYHLVLMPLGDNPAEWRQLLTDQRIDGAIVLSRLLPQLAEALIGTGTPTALVNADTELHLPKVLADEYDGAKQSMDHLFSLGHKKIVFLLGQQPPHYSVNQRIAAYRDAMEGAGLKQNIQILECDAAEFAQNFKQSTDRPTAVMCYTHYLAIKLLQKAWEQGLRVPNDLSVTCFSNAYPVEDVVPPLTTVALATVQMGRSAAELVMEQIETKGAAIKRGVILKTQLIVRQSTAAPAASPAGSRVS